MLSDHWIDQSSHGAVFRRAIMFYKHRSVAARSIPYQFVQRPWAFLTSLVAVSKATDEISIPWHH
jgi:hypothetical protein